MRNIWQAAYTAGTILPKPIATAQYWHRSLNPKKLIEVQFSRLGVSSTADIFSLHAVKKLIVTSSSVSSLPNLQMRVLTHFLAMDQCKNCCILNSLLSPCGNERNA